ncbi:UNKNOWN [Stylonychia lemnae]|uniref:Uncharacterized protein n=1 Tax=Stylonychia lemnae TaxID=5949 RepID=A0A078B3R4_STYLE|nr:UNKNOWN [Stylonychia lemnae]|eukprot:CDW88148.1 UNKNOWN [Stylonychia lemnae]
MQTHSQSFPETHFEFLNNLALEQSDSNSSSSRAQSHKHKQIISNDAKTQYESQGEEFYDQMQNEINNYEDVNLINEEQQINAGGGADIFQKDRPLSLLQKCSKIAKTHDYDQNQSKIINLVKTELVLDKMKSQQYGQPKREDHDNSSNEELIDYQRAPSPNDIMRQTQIHHQPIVQIRNSQPTTTTNQSSDLNFSQTLHSYERQNVKIKRLEIKRAQLEKELHKQLLQQQLLGARLQKRAFQDIKIENSKLDIGIARCYINKNLLNPHLEKEKLKEFEMFYQIEVLGNQVFPDEVRKNQLFNSERIQIKGQAQIIQWNQTFTINLVEGLEKLQIKICLFSIVMGKLQIETLDLDIDKLLPKLMDQKIKQMPFVTKNECAFEIILKWRYDDTKQKHKEISRRIIKIRQVLDDYHRQIQDAINENSITANSTGRIDETAIQNQTDNMQQSQYSEYGEIYHATPCFSNPNIDKKATTEYLTTGQKKRVLARKSSKTPSKYSSSRISGTGKSQDGGGERDHSNTSSNTGYIPHFQNPPDSGYTSLQSPLTNDHHHHNRVPSFSNSNDFLPMCKTSRPDYQEDIMETKEQDEFSTVELDKDSPNEREKARLNQDFLKYQKKLKLNRMQNILEKKFSKMANRTVKIPTRNSSSGQNSILINKDKKSSIIEIKEKVKLSISQKMQNPQVTQNLYNPENIPIKQQFLKANNQLFARQSQQVRVVRHINLNSNETNPAGDVTFDNQKTRVAVASAKTSSNLLLFQPSFTTPPSNSQSKDKNESDYNQTNQQPTVYQINKKKNSHAAHSLLQFQKRTSPDSTIPQIKVFDPLNNNISYSTQLHTERPSIKQSENLEQDFMQEHPGIKDQKHSPRISEITQFKGISPQQLANQLIKDRSTAKIDKPPLNPPKTDSSLNKFILNNPKRQSANFNINDIKRLKQQKLIQLSSISQHKSSNSIGSSYGITPQGSTFRVNDSSTIDKTKKVVEIDLFSDNGTKEEEAKSDSGSITRSIGNFFKRLF